MFLASIFILFCIASGIFLQSRLLAGPPGNPESAVQESPSDRLVIRTISVAVSPRPARATHGARTAFPITYRILEECRVTVRVLGGDGGILHEFHRGKQKPGKYRIIGDGRADGKVDPARDAARVELSLEAVDG